jgi:amidophosphoribosyltransferase
MCGIVGVIGILNASELSRQMLLALQHRGQESAGIVSAHKGKLSCVQGLGLVEEVLRDVNMAKRLPGNMAIGHVRYSTAGDPDSISSVQPFVAKTAALQIALAHNGNLTNDALVRAALENEGVILNSNSDSELLLPLIMRARAADFVERLIKAFDAIEGSYTTLVLTPNELIAAVDPQGFRPLWFAPYKDGVLFASETCALDLFGIRPGAMTKIKPGSVLSFATANPTAHRLVRFGKTCPGRECSFERIYFARPDSMNTVDEEVAFVRKRLGTLLARRHPVEADLVTAVPDSSNFQALACAVQLGIPFEFAIIRNHYTGRTFITPGVIVRELGIRMKLNVVKGIVRGKRVVVVDDSVVRGPTSAKVVDLMRAAGAVEVHLRIAAPPVIDSCHWGINTPTREELIASSHTVSEIGRIIKADSIKFLSVGDLRRALRDPRGERHCLTCFTGESPFVKDRRK